MKDTDYVDVLSIKPLYFIIDKADGYTEQINENKYLTLVFNDKNKKY